MTTDNGSSRSQAEVHKDVRDEVVQGDADLICGSFNRTVVQWWTELNFAGAKPPKVFRKTEEDEDINDRADRDTKIKGLGFSPTQEYLQEVYGEEYAKWEKNETPEIPGGPDVPKPGVPAGFAESAGRLFDQKIRNRRDQAAFVEESKRFANQYAEILGPRVEQVISLAEEVDDLQTFRRELDIIAGQKPSQEVVDRLKNGSFVSRMLGALRGQR
jgi:phage gp29-like protein